ncbi:type 1 glutamine amidotransferase domain-containing protein [Natrinema sp. 74]|uniref:type 1 glutamine amidotransferase domain-containing protein n=1 Tax=Natrinema sp. 74 TaxID=3384159 RepID=UPI0038D481C5
MASALFVVSEEGYWGEECANPLDALRTEDFDIDVATPSGSKPVIDETSLDTDSPFVTEEAAELAQEIHEGYEGIENPEPIASVDAAGYDVVAFPGGHGTMWDINTDVHARTLLRDAVEGDDGKAMVVCHAAGLFAFTRDSDGDYLVADRDVTGFPNEWEADIVDEYDRLPDGRKLPYWVEDEVRAVGADWDAEPDAEESVTVDGDLITARGPLSSGAAADALLSELGVEASASD